MFATSFANWLERRGYHYGWIAAGLTFLTMLVMAGALGASGVFLVPLEKEFGWTAAEVSTAISVRLVLYGLLGPFAAALMNRFGVHRMMVIAVIVVAGGLLLSLGMRDLWQLVLLWGVVVGIGTGLTAMVLAATVANRWFTSRRGLVVGMLAASSATGQLIFLPALAFLTDRFGWRFSLTLVAVALLAVGLVVLALMRDRPSDVGLPVYGEDKITPRPTVTPGLGQLISTPIAVLREAAGTSTFWVLFGTFFVCGASTNGLIQTHFIALCADYGIAATAAAGVLAMMGAFDFVGTIGSGWLSDRYDGRWLLFWYYGLRGLSLLYLPFSNFSLYGLTIFAVFYGLDWIATVPPTAHRLTADRFGRERANIVFGWIFAGHQLGAATAAFGAGLTRTEFSTYLPAFFTAGLMCIIAALSILAIGRPGVRPVIQPAE